MDHSFSYYFLQYFSPCMGVLMATLMFAAPIHDLRAALKDGSLRTLNPFPWPFMTGNCLGWVIYAHYTQDPFVLAANVPGLVLSLWLNMGAAKLQYAERMRHRRVLSSGAEQWDSTRSSPLDTVMDNDTVVRECEREDEMILVPIERTFLRIVILWAVTIVMMQWMGGSHFAKPETVIGLVVNLNLIVFYSAPLESLKIVLLTKRSDSIHRPTLYMNFVNTSFWILYGGFVRRDPMIFVPNGIGLTLGIIQGVLCLLYPNEGNLVGSQELAEDQHQPILVERRPVIVDQEGGRDDTAGGVDA